MNVTHPVSEALEKPQPILRIRADSEVPGIIEYGACHTAIGSRTEPLRVDGIRLPRNIYEVLGWPNGRKEVWPDATRGEATKFRVERDQRVDLLPGGRLEFQISDLAHDSMARIAPGERSRRGRAHRQKKRENAKISSHRPQHES